MAYATYLHAIHAKFAYMGTWIPNQTLYVGDVGTLENGRFRPKSSLAELGVDFEVVKGSVETDLQHNSGDSCEVRFGTEAGATPVPGARLNARASVSFGASGAFLFRARRCVEEQLRSVDAVAERIKRLAHAGRWRKEWVLVEQVHRSAGTTVLVCESSTGSVDLEATGAPPGLPFELADASLGTKVVSEKGEVTKLVANAMSAPLYIGLHLDDPWWRLWGRPDLREPRFRGADSLRRLSIDEALGSAPEQ